MPFPSSPSALYSAGQLATTAAYPAHRHQPGTSSSTEPARNGASVPTDTWANGNTNAYTSTACSPSVTGHAGGLRPFRAAPEWYSCSAVTRAISPIAKAARPAPKRETA